MLITFSRSTAIYQLAAEVYFTRGTPLRAVSYMFNFN